MGERRMGATRMRFRGEVLRILPPSGDDVVDAIVADERACMRISFFGEHAAFVLNEVNVGDVLSIENALAYDDESADTVRRLKVAHHSRITIDADGEKISPLRSWKPVDMTVLAIARPEGGKVCVAGVDGDGNWLRPQNIYENEIAAFRNLCVSRIYVDAWKGRRARKEDRFFICCEGIVRELDEHERLALLERIADESVRSAFESGRTLGLIRARRILRIHEKRLKSKRMKKRHETYIHFTFQDDSGSIYRRWACRCAEFYNTWEDMRRRHRLTYKWRMHRMLRKNIVYLAIGLTYTDYGTENLQFGAYPMIVGVHIMKRS